MTKYAETIHKLHKHIVGVLRFKCHIDAFHGTYDEIRFENLKFVDG